MKNINLFSRRLKGIFTLLFFLFINNVLLAQSSLTISGLVTDKNKEPLPGVNVVIKGTNDGTITGFDGKFTFSTKSVTPTSSLVFSFVGYKNTEVKIGNQSEFQITMMESVKELDEIVVVGFGEEKKSDITGAVATIAADDIQNISSPTIGNALQGRAAGVNVTKSSGAPGSGATIRIRGITSLNSTAPLVVVDGVRTGTSLEQAVNIEDIESISVLKDAAAGAIYGKDAANGVIIVTTKRGTKAQSTVRYHTYFSVDEVFNFPELLDANQYSSAFIQGHINDGLSDKQIEQRYPYYLQEFDQSTNWANEMLRPGSTNNHSLSFQGSANNINYYISGNYIDQKGVVINSDYKKYNFRVNTDAQVKPWLKVGQTFTYAFTDRTPLDSRERGNQIYKMIFRANPTIPVYDETNTAGGGYGYDPTGETQWAGANPVAKLNLYDGNDRNNFMYALGYAEISPIENLIWRTNVAGRFNWDRSEDLYHPYYHNPSNFDPNNKYYLNQSQSNKYDIISYLGYSFQVNKHNVSARVGGEYSYGNNESISIRTTNLIDTDIKNGTVDIDPDARQYGHSKGHFGQIGYFGRVNYNFDEKYLFQANVRLDYSDKFGPNQSSGVFPSFSAGWHINKESFMQKDWIDELKLRAGWGILGSDNIARYLFATNYDNYGYSSMYGQLFEGSRVKNPPNKSIKWEENKQLNLGVDFSFLEGKIFGSVEYYDKISSDILIPQQLPPSSGFGSLTANLAETRNTGYDISINYRNRISDFKYKFGVNVNHNANEVLRLAGTELTGSNDGMVVSRTAVGHPQASFYGFQTGGLITSQEQLDMLNNNAPEGYYISPNTKVGDIFFLDIASLDENGNIVMVPDGKVTDEDQTYLGNPWPKFTYGINMNGEYKGFDLTLFWTAQTGVDLFNYNKVYTDRLNGDYNGSTKVLDAFSEDNPNATVPALTFNDLNGNFSRPSQYFLEDGSFLRLKNVVLGYNLPKSVLSTLHLKSMRLYLNASNLLTFTKYSGVDPEFASGNNRLQGVDSFSNYPQFRSFTAGVQVTF
ncbi:TonB-dependent receptor [Persicobacter diffluens]|uniref:SusC/RagA family TonB-linked outer membrane protein n=1 Tax=Persicobacter diffluens TaxID=981 RepID=A0AAN4W3V6_9BACT|nr:SusC/RagA family TonB-linked outer membrane protein [Persicobacter diffluens]